MGIFVTNLSFAIFVCIFIFDNRNRTKFLKIFLIFTQLLNFHCYKYRRDILILFSNILPIDFAMAVYCDVGVLRHAQSPCAPPKHLLLFFPTCPPLYFRCTLSVWKSPGFRFLFTRLGACTLCPKDENLPLFRHPFLWYYFLFFLSAYIRSFFFFWASCLFLFCSAFFFSVSVLFFGCLN